MGTPLQTHPSIWKRNSHTLTPPSPGVQNAFWGFLKIFVHIIFYIDFHGFLVPFWRFFRCQNVCFWGGFGFLFFGLISDLIFALIFRPPKNIQKGRGSCLWWTLSPPSSDSSPLVKPLRVLPHRHRTHWASQSFPEEQTSVLWAQNSSGGHNSAREKCSSAHCNVHLSWYCWESLTLIEAVCILKLWSCFVA